jgi:hypothetical protein
MVTALTHRSQGHLISELGCPSLVAKTAVMKDLVCFLQFFVLCSSQVKTPAFWEALRLQVDVVPISSLHLI